MKAKNLRILVLLIILAISVPALASGVNIKTFEEFEPIEIAWSTRNDNLMAVLPKTAKATAEDGTEHELELDWDLINFYPWQSKEYNLIGYYSNKDKLLPTARAFELSVTVLPPEKAELFAVPQSKNFSFGSSHDRIRDGLPSEVDIVENSQNQIYTYKQSVSWNLSGQKFDKPGTYTITANFNLREDLVGKGYAKPTVEFDVIIDKAVVTKVVLPELKDLEVAEGLNADQLNEIIKAYVDALDVKLATAAGIEFDMEDYKIDSSKYFETGATSVKVVITPISTDNYTVKDGVSFEINLNRPSERVTRIHGEDRYETAVKIAEEFFSKPEDAVIASGTNYPDALSSAPLADAVDGPIMLVPDNSLNTIIKNYLEDISFGKIKIVGGNNSVSTDVAKELSDLLNTEPARISGADRIATSIAISEELLELNQKIEALVIVDGYNFADALSAGYIATTLDAPIILFQVGYDYNDLSVLTDDVKNIFVVGGENSVPEAALKNSGLLVEDAEFKRFAGNDRYQTALEVSKYFKDDLKGMILASGEVYPDALVASAITGKYNYSILLTAKDKLDNKVLNFIRENADLPVYIIGGTQTISENVETSIIE